MSLEQKRLQGICCTLKRSCYVACLVSRHMYRIPLTTKSGQNLCSLRSHASGKHFSVKLWHLGFVKVQSYVIKNVCLKLQERCYIIKLTSIEDDDNMLLSNKLHSFGLTTHTIEADFVAPKVNYFQKNSQIAPRA